MTFTKHTAPAAATTAARTEMAIGTDKKLDVMGGLLRFCLLQN